MYVAALGLSVLCFLGVAGYFWRSPAFSVFHPLTFYSAFHGLIFVIRPILAYAYNYDLIYRGYDFLPSDSDKITVILASNLGFLSYAFFCLRAGHAPMQFKNTWANQEERRRLSQIFVWVVAICGPLAMYSLSKAYSTTDNITEGRLLDKATGVFINTSSNGYLSDMQLMAVSICALLIWLARFKPIAFLPTLAFVTLRAGTGGRGPFIAALVSAGLFYLYEKRQRYPGWRIVLAGVLAAGLFTFVGADRGASIRQALGVEEASAYGNSDGDKLGPLQSMDFANMEFFEYLVYVVPQRSGTYSYFLDNLQVLSEPIPRVLWKNKPIGEPFRRISLWDFGRPIGMTRSLPGEGWYCLGWLGVVIWCGLWGHFLGVIYNRFVRSSQATFQTACYMIFLPTLVIALRDGGLVSLAKQTGIYFTPIFVWWVLAKYMGVPRARDLAAIALQRGRQLAATKGSAGAVQPAPTLAGRANAGWIPPAVRRRRAALDDARRSTPPG